MSQPPPPQAYHPAPATSAPPPQSFPPAPTGPTPPQAFPTSSYAPQSYPTPPLHPYDFPSGYNPYGPPAGGTPSPVFPQYLFRMGGRPYISDEGHQLAHVTCSPIESDWISELNPVIPEDTREREALYQKWLERGLAEQASVASFAHFSLQLLSVGAPARLLELTQKAMLDEINHAKLSFGLASAYKGELIYPGEYKSHTLSIQPDINRLVNSTAVEGCFFETNSFLDEANEVELSQDPVVVEVHNTILRDEGNHSKLAWETVHWAINSQKEKSAEMKETVRDLIGKELLNISGENHTIISSFLTLLTSDVTTEEVERIEGYLSSCSNNNKILEITNAILQTLKQI